MNPIQFAQKKGFSTRLENGLALIQSSMVFAPCHCRDWTIAQRAMERTTMVYGSDLTTGSYGMAGTYKTGLKIKLHPKLFTEHPAVRLHLEEIFFHELAHIIANALHRTGSAKHGVLWYWVQNCFGIFPERVSRSIGGYTLTEAIALSIEEEISMEIAAASTPSQ